MGWEPEMQVHRWHVRVQGCFKAGLPQCIWTQLTHLLTCLAVMLYCLGSQLI